MSDDNGELLKDACDQVIHDPDLAPEINHVTNKVVKTHCNEAALLVAQAMGCHEFDTPMGADPMIADALVALIVQNASGRWRLTDGPAATLHALGGGLCFAAMTSVQLDEQHGHICAVYPVGMQWSGSLGKDVPMVANVGTCEAEEKASKAFPVSKGEPGYYAYS